MRKFEIYNSKRSGHQTCAIITYDEASGKAHTRLLCDANTSPDTRDLPLLFELFARQNKFEINSEWTMRWIEDRIPPTGRQNIGEVLRANELHFYDPIELFAKSCGRSSHDDFLARELGSYEYAIMNIPASAARGKTTPNTQSSTAASLPNPCVTFGHKLKEARHTCHMSQRELAEATGINQAIISRIESGHANPTLTTCETLLHACHDSLF